MTALTPTPEQIANGGFFVGLLLGVVAVLVAVWGISEYAVDAIVARWQRRRAARVTDFTERRRLAAIAAIRGDR